MTNKDQVFQNEINHTSDFKFGTTIANVFDDMINRSVPFYGEIQRMIAELAGSYAKGDTDVYDLGCATGATLIGMNTTVNGNVRFIGIDDSTDMLSKCQAKLDEARLTRPVELRVADLNKSIGITNASVVVLCLTLQFVRPIYRANLLNSIYKGLVTGGVLILIEKVLAENNGVNNEFIKNYYDYKRRNHYSDLEIAKKREALENILVPYKLSENILMLRDAGFMQTEVFFKWYNFAGLICYKG